MRKNLIVFAILSMLTTACSESHFISDTTYRQSVENDFIVKRDTINNPELFAVFTQEMTIKEREAMQFIYAYMPLGDVVDYPGELYLESVRTSFAAKREMPWGKDVPEELFRHFVLPIRVNNESLDSARMVIYEELKDRVKGLSMYDAVLEVNHWCHEKVVYSPADARTSAPLATIKTASGRCGEESTLTTVALRAVGIPARQVYVPRWAHSDDNHAWVEAWVDGKWYFLGACEPEPVLNLGWFNGPAFRSLLMHTKVFGKYYGEEEVIDRTECYTEINITSNYTETAPLTVTVVDMEGKPVSNAEIHFGIYNYAEFFPVKKTLTDSLGRANMSAGMGDMVAWGSDGDRFGFTKISFGKQKEVALILDKKHGEEFVAEMDIVPPVEGTIVTPVTEEQRAANTLRLAKEDSIRKAYVNTFIAEDKAAQLAEELALDKEATVRYLLASKGNWSEIERFLRKASAERRQMALHLLGIISAKDLRDTPESVLSDHLNNSPLVTDAMGVEYVLNPRVAYEKLTAYRSILLNELPADLTERAKNNPEELVEFCSGIRIKNEWNPLTIPIMVTGVWNLRMADVHSRDIFFVGLCRTIGIPARIEVITKKPQYYFNNRWTNVSFDGDVPSAVETGRVVASYTPIKGNENPKYETHFTLQKIEKGFPSTLNFTERRGVDMGSSNDWVGLLKNPLTIDAGYYITLSGSRMANGTVLCRIQSWNVEKDKTTQTQLTMRESDEQVAVIGSIDTETKRFTADGYADPQSILSITGRGYFVLAILGAKQEPTNHAMRDFVKNKEFLEKWGRSIVFLFPTEEAEKRFDRNEFGALPSTITFGVDSESQITDMVAASMKLQNKTTLPIVIVADTFGRVVYFSQGYNITLGEQLVKTISKL